MKPRLLVVASTYPRWAVDPEPNFVHELARRLIGEFDVHVVCPHSRGACPSELLDGVHVHRFRYAPAFLEVLVQRGGILANLKHHRWKWILVPPFLVGEMLACWRLNRILKPSCIHAHWIVPQGFALAVLHRLGCKFPPLLITSHGGDLFGLRGVFLSWLKRWVLKSFDAITVVSSPMRNIVETLGVEVERIDVIPMGVDFDETFSAGNESTVISDALLFAGRLVEKKGVRYLLEAMPRIIEHVPHARLKIAGHGPQESALKSLAYQLGISDRVEFLGVVPQVALGGLYRSSAVFVAPFVEAEDGDQEGLGLVTVEAISCGCPVVVTALPAVLDILDADEDGAMLAPPADVDALAQQIIWSLQNQEFARASVRRVRVRLHEHMGWPGIAQRYAKRIHAVATTHSTSD